ncbi:MAG: LysM peptidoglycan-binding domain-containing protein [Chloroflexi bacterium]|nr:LysM peptidoglycan-binding domain-containing protein [Chloroflexota bacterium]
MRNRSKTGNQGSDARARGAGEKRARWLFALLAWSGVILMLAGCAETIPSPPIEVENATTTTPTPAAVLYTVRPGDTLSGIAAQYGVDVELLIRVNELEDPDALLPGQKILITERMTVSGHLLPTSTPTPLPCREGCIDPPEGCFVKGVIARLDETRLYVLPEDELFDRREADLWFCRVEDAEAAGWVRWTRYGPATPKP